MTFNNGSQTLATVTVFDGVATYTAANLAVGSYTITATYSGDGIYNGLTSNAMTQTVKQSSSISVASGLNPSSYGDSVVLTATVTGGADGENVTFLADGHSIGTGSLSSGIATLTTSNLVAGFTQSRRAMAEMPTTAVRPPL